MPPSGGRVIGGAPASGADVTSVNHRRRQNSATHPLYILARRENTYRLARTISQTPVSKAIPRDSADFAPARGMKPLDHIDFICNLTRFRV